MRKNFSIVLSGAVAVAIVSGFALAASTAPTIVISGQEHWSAGTGSMKGAQVIVLAGNPTRRGLYIVRLKIPAGTVFGSHYHNETENVTIVSGALWVGLGDKMSKPKMFALTAGSFAHVPAKLHHYALTKTVTVLDITGMGPESEIAVGKP
jgi:quercetin dioxygenase-like cupin family protein